MVHRSGGGTADRRQAAIRGRRSSARWASRSASFVGREASDRSLVRPGRPKPGRHADADEMQADADRFSQGSTQPGRQIDPEEIKTYEWEIAPEIQVNSDWRTPPWRGAAEIGQPMSAFW